MLKNSPRLIPYLLQSHQPVKTLLTATQIVNQYCEFSSTTAMEKFGLPKRLQGSTPSVWNEYITLALEYKPLNLGQGFPDEACPAYVTDALAEVAKSPNPLLHQYTRGFKMLRGKKVPPSEGCLEYIISLLSIYEKIKNRKNLPCGHPRLVQAISKLYSKLTERSINPLTEILITSGAYEALYSAIQGHVDVGDEVIIVEPFFDCYEPMVKMAGGVPRFIPLIPKKKNGILSSADWVLDEVELEKLFNAKTKMFILNTPHNPLGKVFSCKELEKIAELCRKWNVLCLSDEVYEWMLFDQAQHIRICTLPGMWERTITIGSAGKTFSVTGWKIGWAYGPANLMVNMQMVHQNSVYTCPTPIQEAVACSFELELKRLGSPECFFYSLPVELKQKRDFMAKFLQDAGMNPTIPEGGYFMLADWTNLEKKINIDSEPDKYRDYKFTKWMTKNVGLQGIPPSAFYSEQNKHLGENYVRYCYIKKQENLEKAAELLQKLQK